MNGATFRQTLSDHRKALLQLGDYLIDCERWAMVEDLLSTLQDVREDLGNASFYAQVNAEYKPGKF